MPVRTSCNDRPRASRQDWRFRLSCRGRSEGSPEGPEAGKRLRFARRRPAARSRPTPVIRRSALCPGLRLRPRRPIAITFSALRQYHSATSSGRHRRYGALNSACKRFCVGIRRRDRHGVAGAVPDRRRSWGPTAPRRRRASRVMPMISETRTENPLEALVALTITDPSFT